MANLTPSLLPTYDAPTQSLPEPTVVPLGVPIVTFPLDPMTPDNLAEVARLAEIGRGQASDVTYSPSEDLLAVASTLGVYIYDSNTLELILHHRITQVPNALSFSPDGSQFATTANDGSVRLWSTHDGDLIRTYESPNAYPSAGVLFSSDGQFLFSGSVDGALRMWRVNDGQLMHTFRANVDIYNPWHGVSSVSASRFSLSSDGNLLATTDGWERVYIWDFRQGTLLEQLAGACVEFSPVDSLLAVCVPESSYETRAVEVRNTSDWSLVKTLPHRDGLVTSITFSPEGETLAISSNFGRLRFWDFASSTVVQELEAPFRSQFNGLALSRDGDSVALLSDDGTLTTQHTAGPAEPRFLAYHVGSIQDVAFSSDESLVASADASGIRIWRVLDGRLLHMLPHTSAQQVAFSPNGRYLASGAFLEGVKLWRVEDGALIYSVLEDQSIDGMAISPDGTSLLVTSGVGHQATLISVVTGRIIGSLPGNLLSCVAFSPSGTQVAIGTYQKVHIVGLPALEVVETLEGGSTSVRDVHFTPDGQLIATGGFNTMIWQYPYGTEARVIPIPGFAVSADGQILALAVVGDPRQFRLQGLQARDPGTRMETEVGSVSAFSFSPSTRLAVVGTSKGSLSLWGVDK